MDQAAPIRALSHDVAPATASRASDNIGAKMCQTCGICGQTSSSAALKELSTVRDDFAAKPKAQRRARKHPEPADAPARSRVTCRKALEKRKKRPCA